MMKNVTNSFDKIRLHAIYPYDRSGKARWLLTELDVAHEDRWLDVEKKENETSEYLQLNPMGRTPVAEIGGRSLFESGAICAYLADLYLDRGLAPQLTSPERSAYQQWMYFAASTIDPIQTRIMTVEDIPAGPVRHEKETSLLTELGDVVTTLDLTLKKSDYLVGQAFTAADICVSYHLYFLLLWPELAEIINKYPGVTNYIHRMKARPAAIKSKVFSYEE